MSRPVASRGAVVVVGIGAAGWAGLADEARHALREASAVIGTPRQLELLPSWLGATRVEWRSPLREAMRGLVDEYSSSGLAVLASGDPMMHGLGRTLVDELGIERLHIVPHPSSVSLACARLGWPIEDVEVVNAVGRGLKRMDLVLRDGGRLLILSAGRDTPAAVAQLLAGRGYGASGLTVLGDLGSERESRVDGTADAWDTQISTGLNVVAVRARRDRAAVATPGPPGARWVTAAAHGEVTRESRTAADAPGATRVGAARVGGLGMAGSWEARASALLLLAPRPGELLWEIGDVGIAQAWVGTHTSCRALVVAAPPDAVTTLPAPDAVLVGRDASAGGLVRACWAALRPGGRIVAVATTVEDTARLAQYRRAIGGRLRRLDFATGVDEDGATRWRPDPSLVLWHHVKPREDTPVEGTGIEKAPVESAVPSSETS